MTDIDERIIVGIIGADGFIGKAITTYLNSLNNYFIVPITRDTYYSATQYEYDVLINANGNSKKFWANNRPLEDFDASVGSVYRTLFDFCFKKYIYISSIDVYKNNVYGFHKHLSELIINKYLSDYVVLRCPLVIGKNMKKGILNDILKEKSLFVTRDSNYQFITNVEVAKIVYKIINRTTIPRSVINIGSTDSLTVSDIIEFLDKDVILEKLGAKTEKYFETPSSDFSFKTAKEYIKDVID